MINHANQNGVNFIKIRILLITWNFPPKIGGMETLLYQLAHNLSSEADILVIGPYSDSKEESEKKIKILRPRKNGLIHFFIFAIFNGYFQLKKENFNIIFGGSAFVSPVVFILSWIFRKKKVIYTHGLDLIYPNPIYQLLFVKLLSKFDLVFVNSQSTRFVAINRNIHPSRVKILTPGIEFSKFEEIPNTNKIKDEYDLDDNFILLSTGRLAPRKGIGEFLQHSFVKVVREFPNILYLIVGDDPTESLSHSANVKEGIIKIINKYHLEKNVRLLGYVKDEDLLKLYHACDIFILPAIPIIGDIEGFGIVLVEAAAAGKPVISTKIGGITDAVEDGVTGILQDPEDWDGIARLIISLINNDQLRKKLGMNGRDRAKTKFDWHSITNQYIFEISNILLHCNQ